MIPSFKVELTTTISFAPWAEPLLVLQTGGGLGEAEGPKLLERVGEHFPDLLWAGPERGGQEAGGVRFLHLRQ